MLPARRPIQVNRNATRDNLRRVVTELKLAGDPVNDGNQREHDEKSEPARLQPEAAPGEPERSGRVALHHRRVASVPAHGETEDQRPARLPAEIEAPAHPQ